MKLQLASLHHWQRLCLLGAAWALVACSSGPVKPTPAELVPSPDVISVQRVWAAQIGAVALPLQAHVLGSAVTVASDDGQLLSLDAASGAELWRVAAGGTGRSGLSAGVGSDGKVAAAVSQNNELVTWVAGREAWRLPLSAQVFTAPLVAGGRVFVLSGDRVISAFDASTGRKLWTQTRTAEPLVLRQAGVLVPVGDTLLVGMSGRLLGLNPANGNVRWDAPIATPRGANEIERLVDLVADVGRQGNEVCVRAFQAAVGCVDAARGKLLWTKPASGSVGLDSDEKLVFGVEGDGKVLTWRRTDGERGWSSDLLKFRSPTAPLVLGRSVVIGDSAGYVHFLSREDGRLLARLATDGSGIAATPVVVADTLVVVTRKGGIFGFRPR